MCTVLLPPGDNPIAVNKYIISYQDQQFVLRVLVGIYFRAGFTKYLAAIASVLLVQRQLTFALPLHSAPPAIKNSFVHQTALNGERSCKARCLISHRYQMNTVSALPFSEGCSR